VAIQTRLAALGSLSDIGELNGIALRRGDGSEFEEGTFTTTGPDNPWLASKSVVVDEPVGGQVSIVNTNCLLFIGTRGELIEYAARQDFGAIQRYRFDAGTVMKTVHCVVPKGRFRSKFAPLIDVPSKSLADYGGYLGFTLEEQLYNIQSGLVIGVLPIPVEWKRQ